MAVDRFELADYLNNELRIFDYQDYGPNGLQVEGSDTIRKIAFAVSATRYSINQAFDHKADALIVHHGLIWKFNSLATITGPYFQRVAPSIRGNINLFGYHLPLDGNMEFGNARCIADILSMRNLSGFGKNGLNFIGVKGDLSIPLSAEELSLVLEKATGRFVHVSIPEERKKINSLGIITGGASDEWKLALQEGLDAYVTGEMSEHHWNESKEAGIAMFAAGHYATEQFGIQRLQKIVENRFDVKTFFIKEQNPA